MTTGLCLNGTPGTLLDVEFTESSICIAGVWKDIEEVFICIGGVWKSLETVSLCVSATWKDVE